MNLKWMITVLLSGWICITGGHIVQEAQAQEADANVHAFALSYIQNRNKAYEQVAARTKASVIKENWLNSVHYLGWPALRYLRKETSLNEYGLDKHVGTFMQLEYDMIQGETTERALHEENRETWIMEKEADGQWRVVDYRNEKDSDLFEEVSKSYPPDLPKDDYLKTNFRVSNQFDKAVQKYGTEDPRLIRFMILQAMGVFNQSKHVKSEEVQTYINKAQDLLLEAFALWQKTNSGNLMRGAITSQFIAQFYAVQKQADKALEWQKKAVAILDVPNRDRYERKTLLHLKNALATWLFETGAKAESRAVFESMIKDCSLVYGTTSQECQPLQAAIDKTKE